MPWASLVALMLATFCAAANETVPAGLLPQLADGFAVSESWAGQLVTLCALGAGLGAVPLTALLQRWSRRTVLIAALLGFTACNLVTAFSTHFAITLAARFVVGLATGLAWSEIATYARRLVSPARQGRALAVAMLGVPLALALGVPMAALLGHMIGWRWVFGGLGAFALVLAGWMRWIVPDVPGAAPGTRAPVGDVLRLPGVRAVLAVAMLWVVAHYTLYTYIAPFLASAGMGERLATVLSTFGVFTLVGLWGIGLWVDRWLRRLVLLALAAFVAVIVAFGAWPTCRVVLVAGAVLWGLSFSGAPTLLQTALGNAAGAHENVAQSMLVTVFNLSFAGSGVLGGAVLSTLGAAALPHVLLLLAIAAWGVAYLARRHGFVQRAGH
ncbi:MFS transporter [Pandoraea nosoerga]|uniref:MFS transporter n=1 Tax=Pandoraea nosoerga TaxID=2508296 RepID=UPI0019816FE4|nr:MFS transporter [Pandoraea nosoerga]MBN4666064.1 MFS transporter [Pandoraea nosoerga]MBN4676238.1 MFS transporter [Pandoraea nosoerga]MBN4681164.1 MFS transporter [Pandoraea nosoerga]MBN4745348.1 MFS transporter [Pandoraea nosoerga]